MVKRLMFLILSLAVLVGMGLATSAAIAGDGVYGSMDLRWEGWKNALDGNSDNDDAYAYALMRSRIGYKTEIGERGMFNLSFQNIRVLGGDYGYDKSAFGTTINNIVDLNEAYFGINDFVIQGFDAYAGRFALSYGRERIIGTEEWSFYGEHRFDGFKGHYAFEKGWLDLLCLKLYEDFDDRYNDYEGYGWGDNDMRGVYGHLDVADGFYIEPYILWDSWTAWSHEEFPVDLKNDNTYMLGALVDFTNDMGLHFYAEGVLETGTWHDVDFDGEEYVIEDTDVSALGFYAGAFYELDNELKPFVGVEFNYATGWDEGDNGDMKTFYSPYGSYSSYMGIMNIVDWRNTASFRFAGGVTPVEGTDVKVDFFLFNLASENDYLYTKPNPWTDFDGGMWSDDKNVGTEIDFTVDHKIADGINAFGGVSMFSFGDFFGADNDLDSILYGWLGGSVHF